MTKAEREARKLEKQQDDMIAKAYGESCNGIQIPILKTPMVFAEAKRALAGGADFEALKARIRAYVDTIAC